MDNDHARGVWRAHVPGATLMAKRVVVLGVGNILLADEGVGVHAVEALRAEYQVPAEVTLIDGGTSAMELLEDLEGLDLLIILDAVRASRRIRSVWPKYLPRSISSATRRARPSSSGLNR